MKLYIKNMISLSCKMAVKDLLLKLELPFTSIAYGEVEMASAFTPTQRDQFGLELKNLEMEIIDDTKSILIGKIKNLIFHLVRNQEEVPKLNLSDYLSEKLNYNYTYLSNIFSENQSITIEHFMIKLKIERVKELLAYNEMNLTEISWKMHYSSVAHLSNQFKKVTGLTPSFYKISNQKNQLIANM